MTARRTAAIVLAAGHGTRMKSTKAEGYAFDCWAAHGFARISDARGALESIRYVS